MRLLLEIELRLFEERMMKFLIRFDRLEGIDYKAILVTNRWSVDC